MKKVFMDNGFNDFLSKPINTSMLDTILERWIPDEKKLEPSRIKGYSEINGEESNQLGGIDGLDVAKGILMTGGTYEKYFKMLGVFHEDGWEKIQEIKTSLDSEDLRLFTIYIHAIKNACTIFGAEELSVSARALELAGIENDLGFISENSSSFLSNFEVLLKNIGRALSAGRPDANDEAVDIETLKSLLEKYKSALRDMDSVEIQEITEILQDVKYNEDTEHAISEIVQKRLIGDFDEAISLTEILLMRIGYRG